MGSAVALDASVVIGFLQSDDEHHQAALGVMAEVAGDRKVLCAATFGDILVQPIRQGRASVIDRFIDRAAVEVVPVDVGLARVAAPLRAEHGSLSLLDAFVLATAQARDARLLTFDDRLARFA